MDKAHKKYKDGKQGKKYENYKQGKKAGKNLSHFLNKFHRIHSWTKYFFTIFCSRSLEKMGRQMELWQR